MQVFDPDNNYNRSAADEQIGEHSLPRVHPQRLEAR